MSDYKAEMVRKFLNSTEQPPVGLAPMAHVNDLPFRMQLRKHGLNLCWTGMIHSKEWVNDPSTREQQFATCPDDRPLACQITGNNADYLIQLAKDIEPLCDIIDYDCYCIIPRAKDEHYGYFLVDTEDGRRETCERLSKVIKSISHPLSVKTRVLPDNDGIPSAEVTAKFAQDLERIGVSMIEIHGCPYESSPNGSVDIECIKMVVEAVSIPVFANGGIRCQADIPMLIEGTGACGALIGNGFLNNPWLLEKDENDPLEMAREYVAILKEYPNPQIPPAIRHLGFLFNKWLQSHKQAHDVLDQAESPEALDAFLDSYENNVFN